MLMPDIYIDSVLHITPDMLKKLDVFAIILDVDNTIRRYKEIELLDGVLNWIDGLKSSGFKIVIVSNNIRKKVEPVAKLLDIPYISLGFKPLPIGFNRAFKKFGFKKEKIVVVGDQFFTDIIGAKIKGFKTILVHPIKQEKGFFWSLRRNLEKKILKRIMK